MDETRPSEQFYTSGGASRRSGKQIVIIFLVILLLLGLGFGGYQFFQSQSGNQDDLNLTPTPTEFVFPTDTPTPSASASPSISGRISPTRRPGTATPTKGATGGSVDKATGLDRSKLSVTVLNGSGTPGAAKKISDTLISLGYNVISTGNADNYNYTNTVLEVKSTKSDYLNLLKKDLSGNYTIGSTSASLTTGTSDARVIVGK